MHPKTRENYSHLFVWYFILIFFSEIIIANCVQCCTAKE